MILVLIFQLVRSEDPALSIHLNPPEENTKDTINAIKDLGKLEDDIFLGANEDFDEEKKKMIEIQKTRIHDIVHGAFLGINSLIPNPIKASIRKAIRDHIGGKKSDEKIVDISKSQNAVKTDPTNNDIRKQQEKIRKIDEPKFKQVNAKSLRNDYSKVLENTIKEYQSESIVFYLDFDSTIT